MPTERISIFLIVTIVSRTVHCTLPTSADVVTVTPGPKAAPFSTTLPSSSAHATLSDELLDVLNKFDPSLPGAGPQTPARETAPGSHPLAADRISIMHFPAAPTIGSIDGDQPPRSSADSIANPSPLIPGVLHQRPIGNSLMAEPAPSSLAVLQSRGPTENPLPMSATPPITGTGLSSATTADPKSSPAAIPPSSSHSSDPAQLKIEPIRLSHNFNQELTKLLTDLRMTPATLQETVAASDKNKNQAPDPATRAAETLALPSPGSPAQLQPPKVQRPILGPNQTPLDYLLSSSSPIIMHQSNPRLDSTRNTNTNSSLTVVRQPPPNSKQRPNLEFVKYLLTLPRYQQALNELIEAQSSIQT